MKIFLLLLVLTIFLFIIRYVIFFKRKKHNNIVVKSNFINDKKIILDSILNVDDLFDALNNPIIKNDSDFDFDIKNDKKN